MEEWKGVCNIFDTFKYQDLGYYHDFYLATDTLFVVCVIEEIRGVCHETYKLDSFQSFTGSYLSGDALLRVCNADIELLGERDQLKRVENTIRGGVSSASETRYMKANSGYLDSLEPPKPQTYALLVNANNSYGRIKEIFPLPLVDFKMLRNFRNEDILRHPNEFETGFIPKINLCYPDWLYDQYIDFPLVPTKEAISYKDLSDWQPKLIGKYLSINRKSA